MDAVIQTRGLGRCFGSIRAVDGLDLDLGPGEMVGLVGPDGAGKTTAIRLLAGVLAPTAGTGCVLGCDLRRDRDAIRRRIGYLAQQFSLYGDLTVDENIEFCADLHGVRDHTARRRELLEFTRLTPFRTRLADHLSGGMKKKLALACALIHRPPLLLLDEPTTAVDPVSRRDFWRILAGVRREGIAILVTTPYLDEAERCTRVALMHRGRVLRCAAPPALAAGMPGALLEVGASDPRAACRALQGWAWGRTAYTVGERVRVLVAEEQAGIVAARRLLAAAGLASAQVRAVRPRLEDVFIELLGNPTASEDA